jgi:hypothetical protein
MAKDTEIPNPDTELREDSFQTAVAQQGDAAWPVPGDEGYVHPDGTPQSVQQMANNRRAAADRAAAGSTIHGAPAATPGPQLQAEAAAAARRAEAPSDVTPREARQGHAEFVEDGFRKAQDKAEEAAEDVTASSATPREAVPPAKRTATTKGDQTAR